MNEMNIVFEVNSYLMVEISELTVSVINGPGLHLSFHL